MAWLARTLTERQKYGEAEEILVTLLKQRSTFRKVRRLAAQFYAYNFLKQKEYGKAVQPLERAIELTVNKKEKARFYFILGQIQEKLLRDAEALAAYEKVLNYKSIPYDMEFSARMNVALFAYTKGQGSAESAIKSLQKMAKESKNEDYLDQIYFALAQIALKNNDRNLAIENLQKSLRFSKKNPAQKGESYLLMAQLYFSSENFIAAKNYYDSTITVLPKSDDRYDEAKRLAIGLTDIAKNIKIINAKDSLLRIARMSPEEQRAFCLKIKQKDIETAEKAEAAAELAANAKGNPADFNIIYGPGVTPSTFFAYNSKGLTQGARQFQQKWGKNRRL
jgi:tetratricopeptide (TPR) repeat protein